MSDIHLSEKPPRARRGEKNWFDAMATTLAEVETIAREYNAPILCAGDVFDRWRASPELINFAIEHLPKMIAVPGQHDLPLHNMGLLKKSAFWTLVLADKIVPVILDKPFALDDIVIHGFPYGKEITPHARDSKYIHIALCHRYIWQDGFSFPGAPAENHCKALKKSLAGYDVSIFGDNHQGFLTSVGGNPLLNCGSLMRRHSDQENYRPHVGILSQSKNIMLHYLSTAWESFAPTEDDSPVLQKTVKSQEIADFLSGLVETQNKTFDFIEAITIAMKKGRLNKRTQQLIAKSLERET